MTPSYFHFFISKRNALFCVFVSVFLLSACQTVHDTLDSFDPTTMTIARWDKRPDTLSSDMCPDIEIMPELGTIIRFSDPSAPSLETMRTRVDINRAERTCIMNEKTMQVDLSLFFAGRLMQGQQGTGPAGYPFFVAIVSPGGSVLAKEVFSASLSMNGPNSSVHEEKRLDFSFRHSNSHLIGTSLIHMLIQSKAHNRRKIEWSSISE